VQINTDRLLVVDDEAGIRVLLKTVAEALGFEVRTSGNAEEFVAALKAFQPTMLVLDLNMPGCDGVELLRHLAKVGSEALVLLISGEDQRVLNAAERLGQSHGLRMAGVLQKPIMVPELEALLTGTRSRTISTADMRKAIDAEQLRVHYQPQLRIDKRGRWSIGGAEALVRWQHPALGLLLPGQFLAVAEEGNLMAPLTDFVLREAIGQGAAWSRRGQRVNVSVNVPPQLLTDVSLPDTISRLLDQYGMDGSALTLEVTENAAANDPDAMMDILTRLRLKGIGLAIDDFGTGYSSLKQLFCMPFTELKIDRSFVQELTGSAEAKTMVSAMINLAENLGMTACAEGVECQEVLDFLELSGCHSVQGFFICEPVTATEFERFMQDWREGGAQRLISMSRTGLSRHLGGATGGS